MARRRDRVHGPAEPGRDILGHDVGELPRVRHVHLVERDQPRPRRELAAQRGRVAEEFVLQCFDVRDRIAARLERGAVDHVHEHRAALDVPEEVQPEATAFGRARDEARHVGHREYLVARGDDAELRHQRGERVVGDLRPGRGQRRHQRRLARRRKADQPDVGHRPQLQHELAGLTGFAEQRETGRLARSRRERRVAEATAAAFCRDEAGAGADEIADDLAVGIDARPCPRAPRARCPRRWRPAEARPAGLPLPAMAWGRWWKSSRVCTPGSTMSTTSTHRGRRCHRPARRGA